MAEAKNIEGINIICMDCARKIGGTDGPVCTTVNLGICPVCNTEQYVCGVHKWRYPKDVWAKIQKGKSYE